MGARAIRNAKLHLTILTLILVCFALSAIAGDLTYLTARADAIVAGTITTRRESAERVVFDLTIERVIKGDERMTAAHVSHQWKRRGLVFSDPSNDTMNATIRGLWFLQATGSDWDILPANGPDGMMFDLYLPVAAKVPQRYLNTPANGPLDSAVVEFAAGVEAEGGRAQTAVQLLMNVKTPAVDNVAAAYLTSSIPAIQCAGVALALAHNQPNAVATLARMWPVVSQEPARASIISAVRISAVRDSYRDISPASVKQLAAITQDARFSELRPASLRALAAVHTREALPVLAALLQSSDPEERMTGVFGLSSFVNGCPVQTPENVASLEYLQLKNRSVYGDSDTIAHFAFRRGPAEQEAELTSFWIQWWNQHESELTR